MRAAVMAAERAAVLLYGADRSAWKYPAAVADKLDRRKQLTDGKLVDG